jgi:exosortase
VATAATTTTTNLGERRSTLAYWVAVGACVLLVYFQTFYLLAKDWWTDDNYSHGLLLPVALGFLIHQERASWQRLPLNSSWTGIPLILFSQLVALVGYLGAEFFLQRVSFAIFAAGVVVYVWGWRLLREVLLLIFLYLLTVPLPSIIFNQIALPLQLFASTVSENVLGWLNIPVFREGNVLELPNMTLSVAEACSGIRSLMSLITLAVMLAYFMPVRWKWRVLFVASAVPVAIICNAARVAGTGILARHFGEVAAQGFFHSFSGWLIFVLAFALLTVEMMVLNKAARRWKGIAA